MDVLALLQGLLSQLSALQAQLADAEAALAAEKKAAYDLGFSEGVASMQSDKIYSEADLQAKLAEAVLPLQVKIQELEAALVGIDEKVAQEIAKVKAELLAKLKEIDAIEDAEMEKLFV